ncbi:dTDP-glucose 4,6-dehydratase [Rhodohalobacter mucosus]|uniref:dTDP-glucose 4,6-dehydratase n=1 Tax=Rhodohalobacter mucosus TaxID=2079485 RepID=A0A316TYX9_9BACT|nr:dTDP-glucose 4,6-dehydratase [Rhodohalobacter mucosus]PWN08064.1 dTDP-glucose 4,6-dehydratase [Rhodohalobacter mucosus]
MKLIVTGGAGFIGSNLILHIHDTYPDIEILNIDKLTYASDINFLSPLKNSRRYHFKKLDLTDRNRVKDVVKSWQPDGVFHLAAESHVDNSILGPEPFVLSNVVGTFNILEECRQLWFDEVNDNKVKRFLHVSTDEVYGTLDDEGAFSEDTPYAPNSPYSATKAGSDMLVRSYYHTYGLNTVITNCSNNYGRHQHDEKLIPTVIRKALAHQPIPVYGKGDNVRDWLHVDDHCRALVTVFFEGAAGGHYNIGGENEWKNIELVRHICEILNREKGEGPDGDYKSLISFVTDRPGHDYRYSVDISKIKEELNWAPSKNFDELLTQTVKWYIDRYS